MRLPKPMRCTTLTRTPRFPTFQSTPLPLSRVTISVAGRIVSNMNVSIGRSLHLRRILTLASGVCEEVGKDCYCSGPIFDPKLGYKASRDLKAWFPGAVEFYDETKDSPENAKDGRFDKFKQVVDHLRDIHDMLQMGMSHIIQSHQEACNLLTSKRKSWLEANHFVIAQSRTLLALNREFTEKSLADIPASWVDKDAHLSAVYTLRRAGVSYAEELHQYHLARFHVAKKSKDLQTACYRFEKLGFVSKNLDEVFSYDEEEAEVEFRMAHLEKMIRWLSNLQAVVEKFPIYERKKEGPNEPKKMKVHTLPSGKKVELAIWRITTPNHEKQLTSNKDNVKKAKNVAAAENAMVDAGIETLVGPPDFSEEDMKIIRENAAMRRELAMREATKGVAALNLAAPKESAPAEPGKNAAKNKKKADKRKAKKKAQKAEATAEGKSGDGEESEGGESVA